MNEFDRRTFLAAAAAAAAVPVPALASASAGEAADRLVVNALGGFYDPNAERPAGAIASTLARTIDRRVLDDARASGMDAVNVTLGYVAGEMDPFEHTMREIGVWEARLRAHPDRLLKVIEAADIERARRDGRIGIIYGFQNAAMMGDDASRADIFADLGVRIIQLTYNPANRIGDGSMASENRGITPFGREVIERLNGNRIMVDLSHSGQRTCLEAARISSRPVSINHTGCRALTDLPRNKTDEELRLVASRGGFVGIYFMPFLSPDSVATAEDVVAHIDHAVNVCGEDHVGIGTDGGTTGIDDMAAYRARIRQEIAERRAAGIGAAGENPDTLPFVEDLSGPGQFDRLIGLLERRGYAAARIDKIMGLNFLAYAREVWG
ncbi:dipeptidase [Sphingosinicella terrae]|uniref:dipeptidase n=1 Tax=Sphingosinicella terrae TaxID=2172047 RepID=UPI000E0CBFF6|nr:membrane dipeptidase [Sphingosinicella terrae]